MKEPPKEWIKLCRTLQVVLKGQNITHGLPSYAVAKTILKGDTLTMFKQAENTQDNQTLQNFEPCLDDVAKHVLLEKAKQTQKCYMRRNVYFGGGITVKEWVAQ
eukprot:7972311-Ditylum_brightwellii.AAC.1